MFPKRNDPCRPSWREDPDDYDPGPDLYDDEVMTAETRILIFIGDRGKALEIASLLEIAAQKWDEEEQ